MSNFFIPGVTGRAKRVKYLQKQTLLHLSAFACQNQIEGKNNRYTVKSPQRHQDLEMGICKLSPKMGRQRELFNGVIFTLSLLKKVFYSGGDYEK